MANSAITVTVKQTYSDGKMLHVFGTLAIGASPGQYTANGITLNFNDPLIKAQRVPQMVFINGRCTINGQAKYSYVYVPGTDNTNGLLKIFTGDAELSTANMPANVSGDTIDFEAIWLGQN